MSEWGQLKERKRDQFSVLFDISMKSVFIKSRPNDVKVNEFEMARYNTVLYIWYLKRTILTITVGVKTLENLITMNKISHA